MMLSAKSPDLALPFRIKIPYSIPHSCTNTRYLLRAGLEQGGLETTFTTQEILVVPNLETNLLFEAVKSLGFSPAGEGGEYINRYQRFKYKRASIKADTPEELNLFVSAGEQKLEILLEVRKFVGSSPPPVRFALPYTGMKSLDEVCSVFKKVLAEVC